MTGALVRNHQPIPGADRPALGICWTSMQMESAFREYLEAQRRFHERLVELDRQTEPALASFAQGAASSAEIALLDGLVSERRKLFEEYQAKADALVEFLRRVEQESRKSEQESRKKMAEKRARTPRSRADIEKLSEELTSKLRTDRIDDAIKELLAFLSDAEFFAANATTGRRRRLRSLQNAIQGALDG